LKIDEILDKKIIFREEGSGTRELVVKELEKNNISVDCLNIVGFTEDTEVIKNLVSLGVGISLYPIEE